MTSRGIGLALALSWLVAAGACRNGRSGPAQSVTSSSSLAASTEARPAVLLHAGQRVIPIRVEVARTEAEHERGLMFRNHLDADAGMLFIFPRSAPLTFWMKNTFIPLDMLFIDESQHVLGVVEEAVPETETPRRVDGDSRFVLEVVGGLTRRLGIAPGTKVEFRDIEVDQLPN
jgi:uncharacterized membrane protein (UPF0127 family)